MNDAWSEVEADGHFEFVPGNGRGRRGGRTLFCLNVDLRLELLILSRGLRNVLSTVILEIAKIQDRGDRGQYKIAPVSPTSESLFFRELYIYISQLIHLLTTSLRLGSTNGVKR